MKLTIYLALLVTLNAQNTYALPLSNPAQIFPSTLNAIKPSPLWQQNKKPLPTNAWFINFMLGQEKNAPSYPVNCFPYLVRVSAQGIALSYTPAHFYAEPAYPSIISAIFYPFEEQVTVGTVETMRHYGLESYHGLRVTLNWHDAQHRGFSAPLLQGSPYISAFFAHATPQIATPWTWLSVSPGPATRFELVLQKNNALQTWLLYSEKPIVLQGDKHQLQVSEAYTGWIRLVLQNDSATGLSNDPALLDTYSATIPIDYKNSYTSDTYQIDWVTQNAKAPLMLSLPHHRKDNALMTNTLTYNSIKGPMIGISQSRWPMQLPKLSLAWIEAKNVTAFESEQLKKALAEETQWLLKQSFIDDGPYRLGKSLARAARLILIADQLQAYPLKKELLHCLEHFLLKKITEARTWHFQYDTTWGGLIPSQDDYGARHYNDHHFHYGYWVYTFAVIAKFDPAWLKKIVPHKTFSPQQWVEMLIRDYANPEDNDPYFPLQRYQDDYAGHSWASGLSAFMDGQNEQSASEAVNAYYALALYGQAMNDQALEHWGHFLLARELLSSQMYWQVKQDSTIYSPQFTANNAVIANLWGSKVDANAFFWDCKKEYRCGLEYSYGIEMLPFTAISPVLLEREWLKQAYPIIQKVIANQYGPITEAWRWILVKGLSPILSRKEKKYFFQRAVASKPEAYDNGDSKTNTLYFLLND